MATAMAAVMPRIAAVLTPPCGITAIEASSKTVAQGSSTPKWACNLRLMWMKESSAWGTRIMHPCWIATIGAHVAFGDVYMHFRCSAPRNTGMCRVTKANPKPGKVRSFPSAAANHDKPQDSPIRVLRRMALAYGTHGRPLVYQYADPQTGQDRLVYFRAVDTSALNPARQRRHRRQNSSELRQLHRENQTVAVTSLFPSPNNIAV